MPDVPHDFAETLVVAYLFKIRHYLQLHEARIDETGAAAYVELIHASVATSAHGRADRPNGVRYIDGDNRPRSIWQYSNIDCTNILLVLSVYAIRATFTAACILVS